MESILNCILLEILKLGCDRANIYGCLKQNNRTNWMIFYIQSWSTASVVVRTFSQIIGLFYIFRFLNLRNNLIILYYVFVLGHVPLSNSDAVGRGFESYMVHLSQPWNISKLNISIFLISFLRIYRAFLRRVQQYFLLQRSDAYARE